MQYTRQQMLAQLGSLMFSEAPAAPEGGGDAPDPQEGQESSPETDEQEDGDDESQEDESTPFDSDRALRKIQKLNSENKNLRTRAQEAEEKAYGSEELTKTNEQQA